MKHKISLLLATILAVLCLSANAYAVSNGILT